jgi:hypothetical protein
MYRTELNTRRIDLNIHTRNTRSTKHGEWQDSGKSNGGNMSQQKHTNNNFDPKSIMMARL